MTDATSPANGHITESESASAASPDSQGMSGYGDPAEARTSTVPDSGAASAWPGQPGAASPAGWFPSASGEAAPPKPTEPVRTDAGFAAIPALSTDVPDSADPDTEGLGIPGPAIPGQTWLRPNLPGPPTVPRHSSHPGPAIPERDILGAAFGRPAVPGSASGGLDSLPGPDFFTMCHPGPGFVPARRPRPDECPNQHPSVSSMSHSADEDDVCAAEQARASACDHDDTRDQDPAASGAPQTPRQWPPAPQSPLGAWLDPPEPAGWLPGPGQETPTQEPPQEPAQSASSSPESPHAAPATRLPEGTAAVRGWAGGPGFEVPPETAERHCDSAPGSVWQVAYEVWQESGVAWEPSPADDQEAAWYEYPARAFPPLPGLADDPHQGPLPSPFPSLPDSAAQEPGLPAVPPGHPAMASGPLTPPPPFGQAPPRPPEPDDLFRAWQSSVRRATAGGTMNARRRTAWRVLRAAVPAAVVVAVGAGAVSMLTGKPGEAPADRAQHGEPAPPAHGGTVSSRAPTSPAARASASLTGTVFAGYPGQRGTVTVSSMASAGGTRLAVGSADGHPAIWRHAANGAWTLVSAASPGVYRRPGVERLTSVAHGPAGWIAVGGVVSGAAQQPVVVTSANGETWRAIDSLAVFAGWDSHVTGVTASHDGYVVVGMHVVGQRALAAMWWSADLRSWLSGDNGGLTGRLQPSSVYAVASVPAGFVAVGTHGDSASIWTSVDGRRWQVVDIRLPAGASSATLSLVAVNGSRLVAGGYAITRAGHIPIVVVSGDGGRQWDQVVLAAPGGLGAVTALTAAGGGFVAAGQLGRAVGQRVVTWTSPDGLTWSAAASAGVGSRRITVLTAAGDNVTGVAQQGAAPSVVTLRASVGRANSPRAHRVPIRR